MACNEQRKSAFSAHFGLAEVSLKGGCAKPKALKITSEFQWELDSLQIS